MSDKKNYYYNRELSWMDFNARVLEEAQKKDNPLMERLRFLAITGSNLDEFFMVRVAGVKSQIASNYTKPDDSGMTPKELLSALDKSKRRKLRISKIRITNEKLEIKAVASGSALLEKWAFEECAGLFKEVFGLSPELQIKSELLK